MDELLALLSTTEYISGERLCQQLGMTRAAIWKRMEKLREEGYPIHAAGKRGYRLDPTPDNLLPAYVAKELHTLWAGRGILVYERAMPSTNTALKDLARAGAPMGSLAWCEVQTQGKGRLGRSWDAAEGENLLHSLLLCPKLPVERAQLCTLAAAAAMAEAMESLCPGLCVGIKWPNDLVIGGRKCGGILSELSADMDGIHFIVLGMGVNVNQRAFAGELEAKATSLWLETHRSWNRRKLLCEYLSHLEKALEALEKKGFAGIAGAYESRSVTLGAKVRVSGTEADFSGTAERIDETGALWVRDDSGELHRILSGDISVRGVMGYV